jgi:RNA polymerase sigma-70 factor (ECF subfamily)
MTDRAALAQVLPMEEPVPPGGTDPLRWLFESECDYVVRSLRRLGVREPDLPDVTQEVFIAVHRRLGECDLSRPVRPWLFAFALRSAANYRRLARHRREVTLRPGGHPVDSTPESEAMASERRARLMEALDSLDLAHRAAIVLCDIEGMSAPRAAEVLDVPVNTVYSRVRNARRKLEEALRGAGVGRERDG